MGKRQGLSPKSDIDHRRGECGGKGMQAGRVVLQSVCGAVRLWPRSAYRIRSFIAAWHPK